MSVTARYVHKARLCVVPHADNNYHPIALRHKPLAIVSALLISSKLLAVLFVVLLPRTADLSTITSARIVQLTNAERIKAGQKELQVNSQLTQAAQQKGEHMLKEDYFAHISPSGVTPWFWINKVGYSYQVAGENLAIDFDESEDVVAAWLASPTHKENMLLPSYTETGVAVVTGEFQGGTSTIVVHLFGLPSKDKALVAPASTVAPEPSPTPEPVSVSVPTTTSPTPTPVTLTPTPADTLPPNPPVLELKSGPNISDNAAIDITAEVGAIIKFKANNLETGSPVTQSSPVTRTNLSLNHVPDGTINIIATARDSAGNQSPDSNSLIVNKDTEGPRIDEKGLKFVLTMQTDNPKWWMVWGEGNNDIAQVTWRTESETYALKQGEKIFLPFTSEAMLLSLSDQQGNESAVKSVVLAPNYQRGQTNEIKDTPARFNRATRVLATCIFIIILILLSLAVMIHIHVQRPALIAHAGWVLLLAGALLLW